MSCLQPADQRGEVSVLRAAILARNKSKVLKFPQSVGSFSLKLGRNRFFALNFSDKAIGFN
jgi:hypothetical protein